MYKKVNGILQMNGNESNRLQMKVVRVKKQGDMSLLLFIILMDRLLRNTRKKLREHQMVVGYHFGTLVPIYYG